MLLGRSCHTRVVVTLEMLTLICKEAAHDAATSFSRTSWLWVSMYRNWTLWFDRLANASRMKLVSTLH
uniref:Secreted protein n=1 Tax=Peronospora matthiolae TaxID=2874970 RepID=A0AAV1TUJ4_9STRA